MECLRRREAILACACAATTSWFLSLIPVSAAGPQPAEDAPVGFRWRVPAPYVDVVRRNLTYEGTEKAETDARGGPLVVFAGIVLLVYLAEAVLALRRDIVTGGVVIDTRGRHIEIRNDPRLESKWLVVVGPRGSQVYRRGELADPAALAEAIAGARAK